MTVEGVTPVTIPGSNVGDEAELGGYLAIILLMEFVGKEPSL